jgi:DNA-binding CsgD family transcriptional regulator
MSPNPDPTNPTPENPSPTTPPGESGHSQASSGFDEIPTLSDKQLRAIELTIQGYSDARISEILSVDPKTLWRWKTHNEVYRNYLTHARFQRQAVSVDRYQLLLDKSTIILSQALSDPDPKTRFRAANIIFNMAGCFKPLEAKLLDLPIPEPVFPERVG